jgi:hypothetical protein
MGTDITGWIEVKVPPQWGYPDNNDPWSGWTPLVRITRLVERNYGMFGVLFGVRNDYGFRLIAPDRGQPSDLSMELEEWGEISAPPWPFSPSWITWDENKAIDWKELGICPQRTTTREPVVATCSPLAGARRWTSWSA